MSKTSYTFNVLQATAAVASLAIIMWSLGFPTLQFAQAANVTNFSNTLSDSTPSTVSNHLIEFTAADGVAIGETIVLTFDASFTGIAALGFEDVDLNINAAEATVAAAAASGVWGVAFTATTITFTSNDTTVGAGEIVTIEVGLNATSGTAGDSQITNPAKVLAAGVGDSYEIGLTAGASDTGETRVVIMDNVVVTATVDTIFTFTVAGVSGGTLVNTGDTTGGATTATLIPFGVLEAGTASTAAQDLSVSTNAANGFSVTVETDQQLTSNGADIDGFRDGAFTTTPEAWGAAPLATLGLENTYGHWGLSTTDGALTGGANFAGGDSFVSASTTPVEVFSHTGPANGTVNGTGTTTLIYKVQVSALQEAAEDYTATLTYVATPVF